MLIDARALARCPIAVSATYQPPIRPDSLRCWLFPDGCESDGASRVSQLDSETITMPSNLPPPGVPERLDDWGVRRSSTYDGIRRGRNLSSVFAAYGPHSINTLPTFIVARAIGSVILPHLYCRGCAVAAPIFRPVLVCHAAVASKNLTSSWRGSASIRTRWVPTSATYPSVIIRSEK